jgi:quercetin dioxygenase-like cupin family protein
MIKEARLETVASGLTPVSPGWFVVNTRDAAWLTTERGVANCIFESDDFVLRDRPDLDEYVKPGAGFVLRVFEPGQPAGMYHAESVEEDFLVLMGECILVVEDEERRLRAWDFVHCPPGTAHTFIGAGEGPCVLLCAGNRDFDDETFWRVYRPSEAAARYGASAASETTSSAEANASLGDRWDLARPKSWEELPWAR